MVVPPAFLLIVALLCERLLPAQRSGETTSGFVLRARRRVARASICVRAHRHGNVHRGRVWPVYRAHCAEDTCQATSTRTRCILRADRAAAKAPQCARRVPLSIVTKVWPNLARWACGRSAALEAPCESTRAESPCAAQP